MIASEFVALGYFLTESDKCISLSDTPEAIVRIPSHPALLVRAIRARIRQLSARGPVLSASLVLIAKECGRAGCRCTRGEKHVGYYVTKAVGGKTRTVYVPRELLKEVQAWIREHKRLKTLVQEITQLSIAQIRGHVQARRRRRGRP